MTSEERDQKSIELHRELRGKLGVHSLAPIKTREDLSLLYTPGVAAVSRAIAEDVTQAHELTMKKRTVAVVTDGSAVLGLGNIGPEAALPVMEGKAVLFKEFAGVDAFPICLNTQDTEEIIKTIRHIAPGFGGINLEDISAPRCFEIESRLQDLGIPVFHDDQHGTAIVVLAGLINAAKVVGKEMCDLKVVINGAGAAGTAIATLLLGEDGEDPLVASVVACDSQGIISLSRENLNEAKRELLRLTQTEMDGGLEEALHDADVFIGVSVAGALKPEWVDHMNKDSIIFGMANPTPEIMPDTALERGAAVVATGRSDFPNQINNVLVFPGIFKGALESGAARITFKMKRDAALALASLIEEPTAEYVIPDPFDTRVVEAVSGAIKESLV